MPRFIRCLPLFLACLLLPSAGLTWETRFVIQEPFGLAWGPDRVSYPIVPPPGTVKLASLGLRTAAGQPVPHQLSAVVLEADGQTLKSATLHFMVTLAPTEHAAWVLSDQPTPAMPNPLTVTQSEGRLELANQLTGIRLAGGARDYATPVPAKTVPAPLQAVRLSDGAWIGQGQWDTPLACEAYAVTVLASGPVFARAELSYRFAGGRSYRVEVELNAGQDLAVLTESYDLGQDTPIPMSGLNGMKEGQQYRYVLPSFRSPDHELIWDWWGQTMARLPTPNAYTFSFHEGLNPDSADFHGRSQYGNLKAGDGGLRRDQDGRFAYLNSYLQWGDEETLYLGLYQASQPARQLAVVSLRPSAWLHPDILPHPDAIIQQYTQTTCLSFERRQTGELWLRAPVDLGRRVYGIGGVARTQARQVLPERQGPKLSDDERWGSDLMLRHVRLGRLELNTVKDWVLDYEEPAVYPRLFVPPGDRARYESRRSRKPLAEVQAALAAQTAPSAAEQAAVTNALAKTRHLVQHFARSDKGHMDFGIEEGVLADLAEDALASPAITPAQARELRTYLAAIAYFAQHPDFVPPRRAGFAWGSANMMAQVQCRACRIVALLPNHPRNAAWRTALAKVVTLYVEDQINPHGVTLECPHYGGMAITMPAMGLAALASCGEVDLTRATARLRAAALMRLGTLLPPDPRGGMRSQCPEGDGYYDAEATFATLAGYFQERDPQLAQQLAWGVRECGNALGGHSDSSFKLFEVGLAPLEPRLVSQHYPGHGVVMRQGFPRADESYVQLYGGSFSWGHGHNDRGTWVMYAKGAPLMMDFAAMYTPSMRQLWLHPGGLTFDHDESVHPASDDAAHDWWRKSHVEAYRKVATAPFTVLEPRASPASAADLDRLGEISVFKSTTEADYTVMRRQLSYLHRVPYLLREPHGQDLFDDSVGQERYLKQPFLWTRQALLVKDPDPLGPNYLVIRDDLSGNQELRAYLNLWALASQMTQNGQTLVYTGQHGVDLYCYVAEPSEFQAFTRALGHDNAFGFNQYYRKTFGKKFREEQLLARVPQAKAGGGFFVALVPVSAGSPAPTFSTLGEGQALAIRFADRVDTVLLSPRPATLELAGQKLTGTAAVARTRTGQAATLTILAD